MTHVAEVDDSGDLTGAINQRIIRGQIAVDHLRSQPAPPRRYMVPESVEYIDDQASLVSIPN